MERERESTTLLPYFIFFIILSFIYICVCVLLYDNVERAFFTSEIYFTLCTLASFSLFVFSFFSLFFGFFFFYFFFSLYPYLLQFSFFFCFLVLREDIIESWENNPRRHFVVVDFYLLLLYFFFAECQFSEENGILFYIDLGKEQYTYRRIIFRHGGFYIMYSL